MELHAKHLRVEHGGRCVLDVAELRLQPGRVHALLGPNGAGKSTLLNAMAGLDATLCHTITLDGKPLSNWPPRELARQRALLSQEHTVPFDFSVQDIVEMGRFPHADCPHPREAHLVSESLTRTGTAHLGGRLLATLSGGEKARVHLARVLAQITALPDDQRPRWLFLDEPTAALDLAHQQGVMRLLRTLASQGCGIVVVLHDMNLANSHADQVVVLAGGRIVRAGASHEVLQPPLIRQVWGVACERVPLAHPDPRQREWLAFP